MSNYHEETPDLTSGPTAVYVVQFHLNSDVDSHANAQHHTLGIKSTQASPGHHTHDGLNSKKLLDGLEFSGVDPADWLETVIAGLVRLGAVDNR